MFSIKECLRWRNQITNLLVVFDCQVYSALGFNTSVLSCKNVAKNLKGKSKSSQEWLIRQISDPYIEKAKMHNYRCRSAFKLIEMDDKFKFLSPGQRCVDCGAAPGSWTQVLVRRTNALGTDSKKPLGKIVAVDRLPIYPVEGAAIFGGMDFTLPSTRARLMEELNGEKVDVVVSDMAPNATGVKSMDHENIVMLAYMALRFAIQVSQVDATVLLKVWDGGDSSALERDLEKFYHKVKSVKPGASRTDSAEKFLLARGFKGLKTPDSGG